MSSPNKPEFSTLPPGGDSSQRNAVYRLRHDVYIREMQLPLAHSGQMLSDDLDEHSTLFLMWMDNELVGTARTTDCRLGDMELLRQSDEWNDEIRKIIQANDHSVVEITRLMIRKELRGRDLIARLLLTVISALRTENVRLAIGAVDAARGRLYSRFGAVIDHRKSCRLHVMGQAIDDCFLVQFNIADQYDLIRKKLKAAIPGSTTDDTPEHQ
jgi:predicted GNAT family N-acyltransferase